MVKLCYFKCRVRLAACFDGDWWWEVDLRQVIVVCLSEWHCPGLLLGNCVMPALVRLGFMSWQH